MDRQKGVCNIEYYRCYYVRKSVVKKKKLLLSLSCYYCITTYICIALPAL